MHIEMIVNFPLAMFHDLLLQLSREDHKTSRIEIMQMVFKKAKSVMSYAATSWSSILFVIAILLSEADQMTLNALVYLFMFKANWLSQQTISQ